MGQGGRVGRAGLAAVVLTHLALSIVHGAAHSGAQVALDAAGTLFVYIVILIGPLAGLAVSRWQPQLGAWIVALAMSGSLIFGLINHFIIQGADHVAHVAPAWRALFASTAALLALVEAAGVGIGVSCAVRLRRAS